MLVLLGCNHTSAPVSLRERLAVADGQFAALLAAARATGAVDEMAVISTCNRVEILARGSDAGAAMEALSLLLMREREIDADELERYTYRRVGDAAVRHLFRVAAGLDSMILGEPQILGQVKRAYGLAKEHRGTGAVLDRLFQHCLTSAKRVRTQTGISRNPVSVAFAAVQLAGRIFGDLEGRQALVLGAGKMALLVARHLVSRGVAGVTVASRTYDHAVAAARGVGGEAVNWDRGLELLAASDIVVSCTGAMEPVLTRDTLARITRRRRGGPLFLIDIAVPRDIDPAVNDLDNVYLYDIDGLEQVVDANQAERQRAAAEAERLIDDEVLAFQRWRQHRELTPLIVSLRKTMLSMSRKESERFRSRMGPLTDRQQRELDAFARSLMQKVLHRPIVRLREAIERGDLETCAELYRDLFGLGSRRSPEDAAESAADARTLDDRRQAGPRRILDGGKKDAS